MNTEIGSGGVILAFHNLAPVVIGVHGHAGNIVELLNSLQNVIIGNGFADAEAADLDRAVDCISLSGVDSDNDQLFLGIQVDVNIVFFVDIHIGVNSTGGVAVNVVVDSLGPLNVGITGGELGLQTAYVVADDVGNHFGAVQTGKLIQQDGLVQRLANPQLSPNLQRVVIVGIHNGSRLIERTGCIMGSTLLGIQAACALMFAGMILAQNTTADSGAGGTSVSGALGVVITAGVAKNRGAGMRSALCIGITALITGQSGAGMRGALGVGITALITGQSGAGMSSTFGVSLTAGAAGDSGGLSVSNNVNNIKGVCTICQCLKGCACHIVLCRSVAMYPVVGGTAGIALCSQQCINTVSTGLEGQIISRGFFFSGKSCEGNCGNQHNSDQQQTEDLFHYCFHFKPPNEIFAF